MHVRDRGPCTVVELFNTPTLPLGILRLFVLHRFLLLGAASQIWRDMSVGRKRMTAVEDIIDELFDVWSQNGGNVCRTIVSVCFLNEVFFITRNAKQNIK